MFAAAGIQVVIAIRREREEKRQRQRESPTELLVELWSMMCDCESEASVLYVRDLL